MSRLFIVFDSDQKYPCGWYIIQNNWNDFDVLFPDTEFNVAWFSVDCDLECCLWLHLSSK